MQDKSFLEESAAWYNSPEGLKGEWGEFNKRLTLYRFAAVNKWLEGRNCLEFGTADGESTALALQHFSRVVAVEGAGHFVNLVSKRFAPDIEAGKLEICHTLFGNFTTSEPFDVILAFLVLEHMAEPISFLKRVGSLLNDTGGKLIVIVPNAQSLHRLAAVKMGLLEAPHSLNPQDIHLGHHRIYYKDQLFADIARAGLRRVDHGGIFLKPLTNKQIQDTWTIRMMDGFFELGKDFPDYAAELYVVCEKQ